MGIPKYRKRKFKYLILASIIQTWLIYIYLYSKCKVYEQQYKMVRTHRLCTHLNWCHLLTGDCRYLDISIIIESGISYWHRTSIYVIHIYHEVAYLRYLVFYKQLHERFTFVLFFIFLIGIRNTFHTALLGVCIIIIVYVE